ncbi:MAG: glycosyltransferase family 9 protein [Bacteroidota bacterium]|nr:glycosyltransferase family 9 protein [Bacteroidota bacterium]MDP4226116.1 glycosyltransferase family 9 protein [Bacteroidota bacterium]MDP4273081.1 glycosyltransferase family 9 protein [Bacteroidota bacterium]
MIKFLIIRFSSIGDIVLTTPVVRCLKKQLEGAEIHYVTKKKFASVLYGNPYIDKIHLFDGDLNKTITELKSEKFDYVIDLHHNLRSLIVKFRLGVMDFSFNKLNLKKWLLVHFKINKLPRVHIVNRYLDTVKLFDIVNDNQGLDYFIPSSDEVNVDSLPETFRNGFISFVIGARHATKRLPNDKIISVCRKINLPVILLGGKEDMANGDEIAEIAGEKILNMCGKLNLNQSASLVRQSRLVISHDTGLMHIAAAFKKKIISVWGNTVPEFGMYPYQPDEDSQIIEVPGLKCRPCSKLGYEKCPQKHFNCMNLIDEARIVTLAVRWFG